MQIYVVPTHFMKGGALVTGRSMCIVYATCIESKHIGKPTVLEMVVRWVCECLQSFSMKLISKIQPWNVFCNVQVYAIGVGHIRL